MIRHRPMCFTVLLALAAAAGCNPTRHHDVSPAGGDAMPNAREMTLYNAPPMIEVFDYGFPGGSAGDIIVWHAPLAKALPTKQAPDVEIGLCTGTMIVVRSGGEPLVGEDGAREHRMTQVSFSWHGSNDSLVITGSHPYAQNMPQADRAILRAVVGGTGRFIGARGEIVSTPLGNGWYEHRVRLID